MKENTTLEKAAADDGRQQAMLFSFCFVEGLFPFLVKSALCHIKSPFPHDNLIELWHRT